MRVKKKLYVGLNTRSALATFAYNHIVRRIDPENNGDKPLSGNNRVIYSKVVPPGCEIYGLWLPCDPYLY